MAIRCETIGAPGRSAYSSRMLLDAFCEQCEVGEDDDATCRVGCCPRFEGQAPVGRHVVVCWF